MATRGGLYAKNPPPSLGLRASYVRRCLFSFFGKLGWRDLATYSSPFARETVISACVLLGIPETLVATICTLGVMETFARQWNGSKQFGLRDLFMLTTAVAIAFSFVATDRCLAIKSSDSIVVPPMWVQIAGIFGLACVIYAIALIIEHALKHPEDFSLGKSRKIGRAWTTRSPTGSRHQKKSCP